VRLLGIIRRRLELGEKFHELGVEELVLEAGISRTTFYVYFEDKNDLLRAWFRAVTDEINQVAAEWWLLPPGPTRTELREALAKIVHTYRPYTALLSATHEAVGYDAATRELVVEAMKAYVDGLRVHIEAGQAGGFIDMSLPAAQTAYWLQWMAERGLHQIPVDADEHEITQLIDAYAGIVWNALYAPMLGESGLRRRMGG
jgi:AcrR family transcriptional regulator